MVEISNESLFQKFCYLGYKTLELLEYSKQKYNSNCSGKFMRRTTWVYTESFKIDEIWLSQGSWTNELFSHETYHSKTFRYEIMKSPLFKKLSVSHIHYFVWKSRMINGTFLSFSLITKSMNMIKIWLNFSVAYLDNILTGFWVRKTSQKVRFLSIFIQIWKFWPGSRNLVTRSGSATAFMRLKDFREPLLSFEFMHFRNSFCYRIENNWSFKYKILSRAGPLGTLGLLRFRGFLRFLFILKLPYSKLFHSTLNYASTANIEEVMKFCNLGKQHFWNRL